MDFHPEDTVLRLHPEPQKTFVELQDRIKAQCRQLDLESTELQNEKRTLEAWTAEFSNQTLAFDKLYSELLRAQKERIESELEMFPFEQDRQAVLQRIQSTKKETLNLQNEIDELEGDTIDEASVAHSLRLSTYLNYLEREIRITEEIKQQRIDMLHYVEEEIVRLDEARQSKTQECDLLRSQNQAHQSESREEEDEDEIGKLATLIRDRLSKRAHLRTALKSLKGAYDSSNGHSAD